MIEELKEILLGKEGTLLSSRMTESFMKKQQKDFHSFIMNSTDFYSDSEIKYSKRIELLLTGVTKRMICLHCKIELDPNKRGKNRNYCSSLCCGFSQKGVTWKQSTETKTLADTKRKTSNLIKYGYEYNSQRPEIKPILSAKRKIYYTSEGIDYQKLDSVEFLRKLYFDENQTLTDISEIIGCHYGTVSDRLKAAGYIIKKGSNSSKEERHFLKYITDLGFNVIQNDRSLIAPYEIDLFIPEINLAIEYNGLPWHSDIFGNKDYKYHLNKTIMCEKLGIKLIHIFSGDYYNNSTIVESIITNALGKNKNRIYARNTKVCRIDNKLSANFLKENHLKGSAVSKFSIGLYHCGHLVQVTTYGVPRFSRTHTYEIIRSASIIGTSVVGGFSKINSFFIKNYCTAGDTIMTYADRSISSGNVYAKSGFSFSKYTQPGYYYTKKNVVYNRQLFQKHKLVDLPGYSVDKTEWQIMQENNYDRYWDCGNSVYIYTI